MVVFAVVIPTGSLLLRVCGVQPCCADIQVFIQLLSTFHPRVQQDPLGATSSMLRTSSSTDSSTNATRITVKYDEVDGGGGKSVEKSSGSQRIVKKSEKPQRPEKSQRSSVRRNVYRSTDPPSIRYEELESSDSFSSSFCWDQEELSRYHF